MVVQREICVSPIKSTYNRLFPMQKAIIKTVNSYVFQIFLLVTIVCAGILVGLETFPNIVSQYGHLLQVLDRLIIWIFVGEFFLKVAAEGKQPWRYFYDPWNIFDFCIILAVFLPIDNNYLIVLRLGRILRILKLIRALPRLQVLVCALLKSLPSMAYVFLLLFLLFYIYGTTATFIFSKNDPLHFGSLPKSMLSMFQISTLEGWADIMYIQIYGCDRFGYEGIEYLCTSPQSSPLVSAVFFTSFVILGAMIIINLFIGVMTTSLEEAHREQQSYSEEMEILTQFKENENRVEVKLEELQAKIDRMQKMLERMSQKE
jgi:voltage-gated sodium channel